MLPLIEFRVLDKNSIHFGVDIQTLMNNAGMAISDFILDFLVSKGVKKVFLLTGGAIAFLVDSFHKRKDISYICVQHELSLIQI